MTVYHKMTTNIRTVTKNQYFDLSACAYTHNLDNLTDKSIQIIYVTSGVLQC